MKTFRCGDRIKVINYQNVSPEAADAITGNTGTVVEIVSSARPCLVKVNLDTEIDDVNTGLDWIFFPDEIEVI